MASLLSVLGCGPAVSEQDSAREQPARQTAPLYVQNGVTRWSPGATIPVCWINPGFEAEKDVIVRALRHTWEAYGNITFGGFIPCPTTGTQRFIRVLVELGTDTWGGGSSFQGQGALRSPTTDVSVRSTHIALPQNGHLGRIEYLA
ncbi:MAG TPA: hypothetical protein VEU33_11485, partial [Archangium sp.]|nr:hypothetical protein [Archangium sp.]